MCDDGPCRSNIRCTLKEDGCLYFDAVRSAMSAHAPLTNYAYWLAMRKYSHGLGHVDRLIVDEAHSLPDELMKAHQITIYRHELRGFWGRTIAQWKEWANLRANQLHHDSGDHEDSRVKHQRAIEKYKQLREIDDTWQYDRTPTGVTFEPTVPRLLFPLLADDSTSIVYLSATVNSAMLNLLDVEDSDVEMLTLPSTFPIERRPVYVVKTARVQHNMSAEARTYWHARIDQIIRPRLDRKGIVHCVSYDRQREIVRQSQYSRFMLAPKAHELIATVERFKRLPAPAILVSPSIEQGFDFPYSECEYIILPKMPFPDTRSRIMQARIAATPDYRDYSTMTRLQQAAGRGMRADDDACEIFVLDDHCRWFLHKFAHLAAPSFLSAVQYVSVLPRPPDALDRSAPHRVSSFGYR